jgi:hypothetical protein
VCDADTDYGRAAMPRTLHFDDADLALYLALKRDGRARYHDLARETVAFEYLVKRRLIRLKGSAAGLPSR